MIEINGSKLLVCHGDYYLNLENIYLGDNRIDHYKMHAAYSRWILSNKIKVYIHVKMIKGDSLYTALNKVLSREHYLDTDYTGIEKE